MFYYDERIAEVTQVQQRVYQPLIIPLVQSDGRFVKDVQHSD